MPATTDSILRLVQQALDQFDDKPLEVAVRRAARIASLLGESLLAVRFGLELRGTGGDPTANAEDTRRLMADPSTWGDPDGVAEQALAGYLADRRVGDDKILALSVAQIEYWHNYVQGEQIPDVETLMTRVEQMEQLGRIRHRTFTALCMWERRLTFGGANESIFSRYQTRVDRLLTEGAPQLVDQMNAVHRRLRDAVSADPEETAEEDLSQAVTTCRRILKAVCDHVLPGESGAVSDEGHVLDNEKYRNRLHEFIKRAGTGSAMTAAVDAQIVGVTERFEALDTLASKGVHADVALAEAELLAISTYIVAGEILRIANTASPK